MGNSANNGRKHNVSLYVRKNYFVLQPRYNQIYQCRSDYLEYQTNRRRPIMNF